MSIEAKHRFSAELDFDLYKQLRDKSKQMRIPMTCLIAEGIEILLNKYKDIVDNKKEG
jgi:hypothetical protein